MTTNQQLTQTDLLNKNIVRSDINLEKWSIFTTQNNTGYRILKRETKNTDGSTLKQTVSIGLPGSNETLTTEEAKIFYLLLKQWEEKGGHPSGTIPGSFRDIYLRLHNIDGRKDGKSTRFGNWEKKWFQEKLTRLVRTPIVFNNAYKVGQDEYSTEESFTLLNKVDLFSRKNSKTKSYFELSHFTIHPLIIQSIKRSMIKPLRLDCIVKLRMEISIILYRFLDIILSDKTQYERDIESLAEELNFKSKYRKDLISKLRKSCKELDGKPLSHGQITYCNIEKMKSAKGWKLVVKKGKQTHSEDANTDNHVISSDIVDEIPGLLAMFEGLPEEKKSAIIDRQESIYQEKYGRIGGDLTKRYALADAIIEYRESAKEDGVTKHSNQ